MHFDATFRALPEGQFQLDVASILTTRGSPLAGKVVVRPSRKVAEHGPTVELQLSRAEFDALPEVRSPLVEAGRHRELADGNISIPFRFTIQAVEAAYIDESPANMAMVDTTRTSRAIFSAGEIADLVTAHLDPLFTPLLELGDSDLPRLK